MIQSGHTTTIALVHANPAEPVQASNMQQQTLPGSEKQNLHQVQLSQTDHTYCFVNHKQTQFRKVTCTITRVP